MIIRRRPLHISLALVLALVAGCGGAGQPAPDEASPSSLEGSPIPSTPEVATSPSLPPTPSPSPIASAAMRDCLDPAVYDLLQRVSRFPQDGEKLVEQNADVLIAGLEDWAPAATFDADYRDRVVAAIKSKDYGGALQLIGGGIATGQWSMKSC